MMHPALPIRSYTDQAKHRHFGLLLPSGKVVLSTALNYEDAKQYDSHIQDVLTPKLQQALATAEAILQTRGYSKIKYYGVTSAGTDTPKSTRYPYIPASPPPCARVYSAAMNSSCTCLRTHLQPFAARMHDKVALGDKNFPTEAHWQQTLEHLIACGEATRADAEKLDAFAAEMQALASSWRAAKAEAAAAAAAAARAQAAAARRAGARGAAQAYAYQAPLQCQYQYQCQQQRHQPPAGAAQALQGWFHPQALPQHLPRPLHHHHQQQQQSAWAPQGSNAAAYAPAMQPCFLPGSISPASPGLQPAAPSTEAAATQRPDIAPELLLGCHVKGDDWQMHTAKPDSHTLLVSGVRIEQWLSGGGFSWVYVAMPVVPSSSRFALKVLFPHREGFTQQQLRSLQGSELAAVQRLRGVECAVQFVAQGTVAIPGTDQKWLCMLMHLCEGRTVAEEMAAARSGSSGGSSSRLLGNEYQLRKFAVDMLFLLAKMHTLGIVHRDIKPPNIMLSSQGVPCLIDFGVANVSRRLLDGSVEQAVMQDRVGTVLYAAPAVLADGGSYGEVVDCWSFGVTVLDIMLEGTLSEMFPTNGGDVGAVCAAFQQQLGEFVSGRGGFAGKLAGASTRPGSIRSFIAACCGLAQPGEQHAQSWTANQLLQHAWLR